MKPWAVCVGLGLLLAAQGCAPTVAKRKVAQVLDGACPTARSVQPVGPLHVSRLTGRVAVSSATGSAAVPDAVVHLASVLGAKVVTTRTRADGSFALPASLAPGQYRLLVCAEGFAKLDGQVTIEANAPATPVLLETRAEQ
jgi:siroheme synthase (precorrin-2 oxidase/ferrochelatase)